MQRQTQTPQFTVTDPNQVTEVFANGPMNLQIGREVCTVTFTSIRPDLNKTMQGQTQAMTDAVVVSRVVFPTSQAAQLHTMLGQALSSLTVRSVAAPGPDGGIVAPTGRAH
jgi:hypothetical protein